MSPVFRSPRCNSSVVEHFLGKEEVLSSTLSYSSPGRKDSRHARKPPHTEEKRRKSDRLIHTKYIQKKKLWQKRHSSVPNHT